MKAAAVGLLLVFGAIAHAEAPSFSFRELGGCSAKRDPYTFRDTVRGVRRAGAFVVVVETAVGCSASVTPSVSVGRRTLSVGLDAREDGTHVAACLCARRFEFTLAEPVPKGAVLYFVKGRNGVAHATAP